MFQILVVEDDADLQNLFCKTLMRNNYQSYGAKNVQQALDILEKEYIDLIISDVMMKGTNGFDFVRQLRESRIEIPVLIITAKGDIMDKQCGFNAGADDYMVKPIDINEMLLRVNALLRRAKSVSEKSLLSAILRLNIIPAQQQMKTAHRYFLLKNSSCFTSCSPIPDRFLHVSRYWTISGVLKIMLIRIPLMFT